MGARTRIQQALAANAFGQVVTIISQLALTPLYFRLWGAPLYGEWLLLSSLPSYLSMVDLGVGAAAGNEMTMRAGASDRSGAQQAFRLSITLSLLAGILTLVIGGVLAGVAHWLHYPHTPRISSPDAAWILMLLAASVALGFIGGVISAGFRCAERNALGISLANLARLLEVTAVVVVLPLGATPTDVAWVICSVKALTLVAQAIWLHACCPWLFGKPSTNDPGLLRRLVAPSLGFMAFPLGNALALQGPVLIIGHFMGGSAVAVFTALRTLSRIPMQVTNALNASVWPEMSRAHGAGELDTLRSLHRTNWGLTLWIVVAAGCILVGLGPWIAQHWLGADTRFEWPLLMLLVLLATVSAVWNASSVVLAAINAHLHLGIRYVTMQGMALALAWALTSTLGWYGLVGSLILAEAMLLLWVTPQALNTTQDGWRGFLQGATPGALISKAGWLR